MRNFVEQSGPSDPKMRLDFVFKKKSTLTLLWNEPEWKFSDTLISNGN